MSRRSIIVTDMGYGDAGKGTTVDYLVRQAESAVVVRHNGGPQAAHNVVTPDGRHHTFAQFGSGTFVPGVRTHLSRHMLINPLNMFREAEHLASLGVHDAWQRLSVDQDALLILPWHQSANRLRELARGGSRHGSCGQGLGEARSDALSRPEGVIKVIDLWDPELPARLEASRRAKYQQLVSELGGSHDDDAWRTFDNPELIPWLLKAYEQWLRQVDVVFGDLFLKHLAEQSELLVFEGAQGVLLDEWHGFHPYTTWTATTHDNALELLAEIDYQEPVTRLGLLRGYTTRHGAGPLLTESAELTNLLPELHNRPDSWQGSFRVGHLDLLAHRYALRSSGVNDGLVVTGLDRLEALSSIGYCDRYRLETPAEDADKFFVFDENGYIRDLRVGVKGDRAYRERLTQLVMQCTPLYEQVSSPTELLQTIEGRLGLPITITSHGPTASDKSALVTC